MDPKHEKTVSKFMSLVLRHRPEALDLVMDEAGWVDLDALCDALGGKFDITRDDVLAIVARDEKGRYVVDKNRIRAAQGHSREVDLQLIPIVPPEQLYHGTTPAAWEAIAREGLHKRQRTHVHLSPDVATAKAVGSRRRDSLVVLAVAAAAMHRDGHAFYRAENGVWLTEHVPPGYLSVIDLN